MDKLISLNMAKQEIRNYIEEPSMITLLDCVLDRVPAVDPMAKGQWMRYDMIVKIIRMQAESCRTDGKRDGADALDELADYFDMISNRIKEKTDE